MRILYLAPLPPPLHGHSLAAKVLLDELSLTHDVDVVDLSHGSTQDGRFTFGRSLEVLKAIGAVWRRQRKADAIYFTISESLAGNVKDLLVYLACSGGLSRMLVHLHGGSLKKVLFDRSRILTTLNHAPLARVGGIVISGEAHSHIFSAVVEPQRVHIVPNFAQDYLFVTRDTIHRKFAAMQPLRILYLSGMTAEKGCFDLVEAYLGTTPDVRRTIQLDFAGKFYSEGERAAFLARVDGVAGITYHGLVDEPEKSRLFAKAHVFCLPSRMFEGQPISILEAYAAGCVVLATGQDGIRDVFTDGVNGFEFRPGVPAELRSVLEMLASVSPRLEGISLANRETAGREFTTQLFTRRLAAILESTATAAKAASA
ncbi:MAG: glycosyltransferase family 4 protein [Usitatibacter sp.]